MNNYLKNKEAFKGNDSWYLGRVLNGEQNFDGQKMEENYSSLYEETTKE